MTTEVNPQTSTSSWEKGRIGPFLGPQRFFLAFHCRAEVKVIEISEGESYVVGRMFPSELVLQDQTLSRQHALFSRNKTAIHVKDLDSRNGIMLRGKRVSETIVCAGDAIALGDVTVVVYSVGMNQKGEGRIIAYDSLIDRLEDEIIRSRQVERSFVLAMLRSSSKPATYVSQFWNDVHDSLRAIDSLSLYGAHSLLIILPESSIEEAEAWANNLIRIYHSTAKLRCGLTAYPSMGTTPQELITGAHESCRMTTKERPVCSLSNRQVQVEVCKEAFVYQSDKMLKIWNLIERVAASKIPVLIQGETGTGKELVARAIHRLSSSGDKIFRAVNCAAIPQTLVESTFFGHEKGAFSGAFKSSPGVFEQAAEGTVFLDEIGELSNHAQASLLRFLETKQVVRVGGSQEKNLSTRILAATHCNLEAMVEQGAFRQDLLYRLNTMIIHIPPLRDRISDIAPLIDHFLKQIAAEWGRPNLKIHADAFTALRKYHWPGNVRQLRNTIERAIVVCPGDTINTTDLPRKILSPEVKETFQIPPSPVGIQKGNNDKKTGFQEQIRAYEVQILKRALYRAQGKRKLAADLLQVPLRTFNQKIKKYGIGNSFD